MISIFPASYPDELFYNWFLRYHKISGNTSLISTMEELYNNKSAQPNIYYPSNLKSLTNKLPHMGLSMNYIIQNHTVYPFLKPFMIKENAEKLLKIMTEKSKGTKRNILSFDNDNECSKHSIKVCPQCFIEDKDSFGEAYIHRMHQIPGNFICTKHMNALIKFPLPNDLPLNAFWDINEISLNSCNTQNRVLSEEELEIGREIKKLTESKLSHLDINVVIKKYKIKLKIDGYLINKNIKQSKLILDFLDRYSKDLLMKLNSYVEVNNKNWIEGLMIYKDRDTMLIRHLLFIIFLFGGVQEFLDFSEEYSPFGEGPWPCLNPVTDHYKQEVIEVYSISKSHDKNKNITGTFKCSCGFIYTRNNKNSNKYDYSSIKEFGLVWEEKLKNTILSSDFTISDISSIMNCNEKTVIKYANKQGLGYKLNREIEFEFNKPKKENNDKIVEYENRVRSYVKNNVGTSRSKIRTALTKEYDYLLQHKRALLEGMLPELLKSKKGFESKDWVNIDKEISKEVTGAVEKILNNEKLIRVTLYSITKFLNHRGIRRKDTLEKLPFTKAVIENVVETLEDFKKRKMKALIHDLNKRGYKINKTEIIKRINFGEGEYERFESFIEEYLNEIQNGQYY